MRRLACVSAKLAFPLGVEVVGPSSAPSAISTTSRSIYPSFSAIACEPWAKEESWLKRLMSRSTYRSHDVLHTPEVSPPKHLSFSAVEIFLLSRIEDDTKRLLSVSWAYDFDSYWGDAVHSHEALMKTIYKGERPFRQWLLGDCSAKKKEMLYIESKLNYLLSLYEWACITEETYSKIYRVRYMMQRTIFNQLERERYLCGCVEAVERVRNTVPQELEEKVMRELDLHLVNLRHWVNGCPVGKTTFTRRLA